MNGEPQLMLNLNAASAHAEFVKHQGEFVAGLNELFATIGAKQQRRRDRRRKRIEEDDDSHPLDEPEQTTKTSKMQQTPKC